MTFVDALDSRPFILAEGAVIERVRRIDPGLLDPFAANATLLYDGRGREILEGIYREYAAIAVRYSLPLIMLTPTWRASLERLARAGLGGRDVNGEAFRFLEGIRADYRDTPAEIFIGGLTGCSGDSYDPHDALGTDRARSYHTGQAEALAVAGVDFLLASTLPSVSEAAGIAAAFAGTGVPYLVSFVIRRDGTLPDGAPLTDAIGAVERAVAAPPLGFLVNCVHPDNFEEGVSAQGNDPEVVRSRVVGLQANASRRSPEELDGAPELDSEEPATWAAGMVRLAPEWGLRILGGCCGTDASHIEALAAARTG